MYKNVFLVKSLATDASEVTKFDEYLKKNYDLNLQSVALETFLESKQFDEDALYLLYLNDNNLKKVISKMRYRDLDIAILPHSEATKAIKSYSLFTDFKKTIDGAMHKENLSYIDILRVNDTIVYSSVIFGDVYGINKKTLPDDSMQKRINRFFANLKKIQFNPYKLVTKEQNSIDTAATGILVYEHNFKESTNSVISEDKSLHDGQLNVLILAPKSIFSLLYLLIVLFFYKRFSLAKLPKSIGLIKSQQVTVTSNQQGIDFLIDGVGVSAKEVTLEVNEDAIKLHLPKDFSNSYSKDEAEKKELLQTQNLPKGEYKKLLIKNDLPLFKRASTDDFKDLFILLKSASTLSSIYIVLMICSTLLATVGLFLDSGPVIIGAMILAPLMAPIVSLSMGVVRDDDRLIKASFHTIFFGVVLAIFSAALFTLLMPVQLYTSQIGARLQPNILDMFVAVFSGIAAAYAYSKEEVAKSLAGVAIAVALVPPLAVTGIGLGWMDYDVIFGSFLLFITNLVGITIAASLTFVVLGFAPLFRAKKRMAYTVVMLFLICIPLAIAFYDIIWQNRMQSKVMVDTQLQLESTTVDYKVLAIDKSSDGVIDLEIEVSSSEILDKAQMLQIKSKLEDKLDSAINLQVRTKLIL